LPPQTDGRLTANANLARGEPKRDHPPNAIADNRGKAEKSRDGAGEALRLKIFGRIFLAISISYGHLQNFVLDVLLDVSLDTRSPLNLARVPLKTNSASMEIREVLLATSVSAKRRFRL